DLAEAGNGNDSEIYTLGGRIAHQFDENWKGRAEFAQQVGKKNGARLCAMGFNSRLEYFLNDENNNNFRVGYEYLSGDRAGTATNEQFDPLWGRWPQFSELYIYPYAGETRIAEVTNLHRINVGWSTWPTKKTELCLDYHLLLADKNTLSGSAGFSGSGNVRGHLLGAIMRHKFNKHVSTHLLGEVFFPGDYYDDTRNDVAMMFRWELMFKL
ncbi:MAG: alginate export family protein, partial [Phycisphaerae bacterium]